jgi:hypothetical protein
VGGKSPNRIRELVEKVESNCENHENAKRKFQNLKFKSDIINFNIILQKHVINFQLDSPLKKF